jgi:hypothetical protein
MKIHSTNTENHGTEKYFFSKSNQKMKYSMKYVINLKIFQNKNLQLGFIIDKWFLFYIHIQSKFQVFLSFRSESIKKKRDFKRMSRKSKQKSRKSRQKSKQKITEAQTKNSLFFLLGFRDFLFGFPGFLFEFRVFLFGFPNFLKILGRQSKQKLIFVWVVGILF